MGWYLFVFFIVLPLGGFIVLEMVARIWDFLIGKEAKNAGRDRKKN